MATPDSSNFRDRIALAAMRSLLCANLQHPNFIWRLRRFFGGKIIFNAESVAKRSYEMADAMIAERWKKDIAERNRRIAANSALAVSPKNPTANFNDVLGRAE